MLEAKLVIIGGANVAQEYPLTLPATIGRSNENCIPLAHSLVSRKHCELFERDGKLFVRDLGSLNGTFVGSQPADGDTPIAPGQLLTIGTVTLRAVYDNYVHGIHEDADVLDATIVREVGGEFAETELAPNGQAGLTMTKLPMTKLAPSNQGGAVTADDVTLDTNSGSSRIDASPVADTERMPPSTANNPSRPRHSR